MFALPKRAASYITLLPFREKGEMGDASVLYKPCLSLLSHPLSASRLVSHVKLNGFCLGVHNRHAKLSLASIGR